MSFDPQQVFFTLVAVGLFLLALEVFLPGGVLGVIGGLALFAAVLTGFAAFGAQGGLLAALAVVGTSAVVLGLWIRLFPKTRMGRTLTLAKDGHTFKASDEHAPELVGREGTAQTDLRPAGIALFDGRRVDVVAETGYVTAATPVRVIRVEGNRIVVRPVS